MLLPVARREQGTLLTVLASLYSKDFDHAPKWIIILDPNEMASILDKQKQMPITFVIVPSPRPNFLRSNLHKNNDNSNRALPHCWIALIVRKSFWGVDSTAVFPYQRGVRMVVKLKTVLFEDQSRKLGGEGSLEATERHGWNELSSLCGQRAGCHEAKEWGLFSLFLKTTVRTKR